MSPWRAAAAAAAAGGGGWVSGWGLAELMKVGESGGLVELSAHLKPCLSGSFSITYHLTNFGCELLGGRSVRTESQFSH